MDKPPIGPIFNLMGGVAPISICTYCTNYTNVRVERLPLAPRSLSMGGPSHYNGVNSVQLCKVPIVLGKHWEHRPEDNLLIIGISLKISALVS